MSSILNVITQVLAYSDTGGVTDNAQRRDFDWTRKFSSIAVENPSGDTVSLLSGESLTLFDGVRSNPLDATSVLSMSYEGNSIYRMKVTGGASGFKEARSITGLGDCTVTVNNNSIATFEFTGATLTGVVAGDIMRISGMCGFDTAPYSFSSLNAGEWNIIDVSGNIVQAVRPTGVPFSGVTENVTGVTADQVEFYSAAGVQSGDKFEISGAFSSASHRVYEVTNARPDEIFFTSASPLPEESGVAYPDPVANGHSIVFYDNAKKMIYIEADQSVVVQFNNDPGEYNKIIPIEVGNPDLVGYIHTFGCYYKAVIVNKSVNTVNVRYFTTE